MHPGMQNGFKTIKRHFQIFNRKSLLEPKSVICSTAFKSSIRNCTTSAKNDMDEPYFLNTLEEQSTVQPTPCLSVFVTENQKFDQLKENHKFMDQLNGIVENIKSMSTEDVVTVLYSLNTLEVPLYHPVVNKSMDEILTRLKDGKINSNL